MRSLTDLPLVKYQWLLVDIVVAQEALTHSHKLGLFTILTPDSCLYNICLPFLYHPLFPLFHN